MEKNQTLPIALFDVYNLNRKAIIRLLERHFPITELECWQDVERSRAKTYIISHPELMTEQQQSVFVDWLRWTSANVIITRHDLDLPWNKKINKLKRKRNIKLITKPTEEQLLQAIQKFTPLTSNCMRLYETKYAT